MMSREDDLCSSTNGRTHQVVREGARLRIQSVERLVEQQQAARQQQRSREERQTQLSIGDLPRAPVGEREQPRLLQCLSRTRSFAAASAASSSPMLECAPDSTISSSVHAVAAYVACSSGDTRPTSRFHSLTGAPDASAGRSIRPPSAGHRSPYSSASNVDLPEPFGPVTHQCSPSRIVQSNAEITIR